MENLAQIKEFEERAFNAWPALQTVLHGGWIFRLANGHTKRANSANAAVYQRSSTRKILDAAEEFYARHRLPCTFRLSPLAGVEIDRILDASGYAWFDPSLVLVAPLSNSLMLESVEITATPSITWLKGFAEANAVDAAKHATHDAMLRSISMPAAFATLHGDSQPIGFGLAVYERGAVGLFDIVIDERYRGRGKGRDLTRALMAWGNAAGADKAYLQVRQQNDAANKLYANLGFQELYRYHYRVPT